MDKNKKLEYRTENRNTKGQWGKWIGKKCIWEGCQEKAKCRGYCFGHYNKKMWSDGHRSPSNNKTYRRNTRLKRNYNITLEKYIELCEKQGGKCAICGNLPKENERANWGGKLCVDHDHKTKKIRALLCNSCNLAVGYIGTEKLAMEVAEYIRFYNR